jgi:hypothetical protein
MKPMQCFAGRIVILALTASLLPGVAAGATRVAHLTLEDALPGDRPMRVHLVLAGGEVAAAFGQARTFNTMSYRVDASGVKVTPKGLTGPIVVAVPSDGWVPKGVASVTCRYELSAVFRNGLVAGSFRGSYGDRERQGKIAGTAEAQGAKPSRCRFKLKVRSPKGAKGLSRVGIEFGWRDGKPIGVKLIPHGSITDIGAATVAKKASLRWRGSKLTGRIEGVLQPNGRKGKPIALELDCVVVGEAVGGTVETTLDDGKPTSGAVRGEMDPSPVPKAGEAIWKLTLQHGVSKGQPMNVFLSTRKGEVASAFAVTPNYNNATHEVDVSKLEFSGETIQGRLDVTIHPDAWIPKDHKKRSASYTIRAELTDAEAAGTFVGTFAGRDVKGNIEGAVRSKPKEGTITKATLKPEGALWNGSWSGYRAFLTFNVKDGKITGGRVWNNHDKALKGDVTDGTFQVADEELTATIHVTVKPGTSAKPGKYVIKAAGPVMGTVSCGNSTSKLQDKTWTSRYWASWEYEETGE